MSQTIAHRDYSVSTTRLNVQGRDSLISTILERIKKIAIVRRPQINAKPGHQSFIDANLLDDTVGPEIARALR